MQKATRFLYELLRNSFLVSAIGLVVGWIVGTENWFGAFLGALGFYGALFTFYIFIAHLVLVVLTYISNNSEPSN